MRYLFRKVSFCLLALAYLLAFCFASTAAAGTLTLAVGGQTDPTAPVSFSVNEGQALTFQVVVSDTDLSKKLHIQASSLPTGASFTPGAQGNPRTATFTWTPSFSQTGSYRGITFTASEKGHGGASTRATVNITVGSCNHAPTLQSPGDKTINEGETLSFTLSASDQDVGDVLRYGAGDLPQGAIVDPITGHFTWTPGFDQAGSYLVTFRVTDTGQPLLGDNRQIAITVGPVNRPPVMDDLGSFTVSEGQTLDFQVFARDPDGDTLTFTAHNIPDGAFFDPATQMFTWSPTSAQSGNYPVTFSATDGMNDTASKMAIITANNVNRPPTLDHIGSQSVDEGATLVITLTGQDPDGNSLTYSAENLPEGATFAGQTFTYSPTSGQVGAYDITFKVTDNGEPPESASEIVHITVNAKGNNITNILRRNTATGQNAVWYMNGETLTSGAWLPALSDLNWQIVGVGDFNADTKPDILWRNTATGQNAVWYMNGETLTSGAWLPALSDLNWQIVRCTVGF
jgi:hypothetical protein